MRIEHNVITGEILELPDAPVVARTASEVKAEQDEIAFAEWKAEQAAIKEAELRAEFNLTKV